MPFQFLLNFAHDDSFFYIKTASNFSKGLGSTFDGINHTNGYHPLYFISLVILFFVPNFLFEASPEFLYRLDFLYHLVVIVFMQYYIIKSLKNVFKKDFNSISVTILIILLSVFIFIRDFGMESHLACLIVSYFLYLKSIELNTGENKIVVKSLLLALLFLTRTDFISSYIPFILIIDFFIGSKKKQYIITSFTILAVTILTYYSINFFFFGSINTVTGKYLNSFPAIAISSNFDTLFADPAKFYNQFVRILIVFVSFILFVIYYKKIKGTEEIKRKFYLIIIFLGTGGLVFTIIHLLYNKLGIREWYMTLPTFVAIIMIVILLPKRKDILNISLILSFIFFVSIFYGTRIMKLKNVSGYEYAKSLNSIVKENERVYQIDFCGVIGFFSDRNVVNGDGLINSFEYIDYVNKGKIDEYIEKYNIKYYSTYTVVNLLEDSVYTDRNFSHMVNGKIFRFPASSLILEKQFKWNHIAFDSDGKWYLFKFKQGKNIE